ncbi:DUF433 domain-containing protein [Georgenia sp. Z1344]|uniref:DUF433 domain-containing protein n=1 Tax=Georgenia sp. Z1344 TaxID=3416706 RepID=UPI003CEFFB8F
MTASLLDRALYSYADVDRLVALQPGTGRRWLEGYTRRETFYEPVLREEPTGSDEVTWGEMVEARLLAEFRAPDVAVARMRPAIEKLRETFGRYPLAHARPFLDVEGRELVQLVQDDVGLDRPLRMVVVRDGQFVLTEAAERFHRSIDYEGAVAGRLRLHRYAPEVVMDPRHAFGQPAVRNVRTEVLAEAYRAGSNREELADLYSLSPDQVDSALRFEMIASTDRVA